MGNPNTMVVEGRDRREQCINVDTKLGEQIPAENRKRIPVRFSLNSKSDENEKRSDIRRSCWIGSGLIVEVDVKGKRRVSWDGNKGGVKNFKWVTWAQIKDVVGLDTNYDQQVGFPNIELTGPIRMEVGESSLLADLSPPMLEAHLSMMAVMSIALHEASLSQNEELGQYGELPRVVNVKADGGFHAEKSPALAI